MPSRRLEETQKLPRGSLVALEDTIVRHVFLIKGERFTLIDIPGTGRRWRATIWVG